jgi:hypothetical protein
MKLATILRLAIVAEWTLDIYTLILSFALEDYLPAPLREYLDAEAKQDFGTLDTLVLAGGLGLILVSLVASICLFLLQKWARWLYLGTLVAGYVFVALTGPEVEHAYTHVLGDLTVLASGVVLAISFCTKVFDKPPPSPSA